MDNYKIAMSFKKCLMGKEAYIAANISLNKKIRQQNFQKLRFCFWFVYFSVK